MNPRDPRRPLRVRTTQELDATATEFEAKVYDALVGEFQALDDMARAGARFERRVYDDVKQRRVQEGWSDDDAGEMPQVFDRAWYEQITGDLVVLKSTIKIIELLGLEPYRDDIVALLVAKMFAPPESKRPDAKGTRDVFLGSEVGAMLKQMQDRRAAQRR